MNRRYVNRTLPRRAILVVVSFAVSILCFAASAGAATEAQLKAQLASLRKQTAAAGAAYDKQYHKIEGIEHDIKAIEKKQAKARKSLARSKSVLSKSISDQYRNGGQLGIFDMLLSVHSWNSFIATLEYSTRINEEHSDAVADVTSLSADLDAQAKTLKSKQREMKKVEVAYKDELSVLEGQLTAKQSEFARLQAQLAQARAAANKKAKVVKATPAKGSKPAQPAVSAGANGMVFPVAGSYYFSDTFGAARSGGRSHQGTDVMAPRGTPLVAFTSGSIRSHNNGLGGLCVYITGSNGWTAYYAHMNSVSVSSGRVKAGQVVGTVGDTGNARGTPHLHIELWKNGSRVNPYSYLRAME